MALYTGPVLRGRKAGHVAIFRGINQNVAGLNLSSVYRRTEIPLAAVPVTDQGAIRSTISATSLAGAQSIVGNIRSDYQTCQAAYQSLQAFQQKQSAYTKALDAYQEEVPPDHRRAGAEPGGHDRRHPAAQAHRDRTHHSRRLPRA